MHGKLINICDISVGKFKENKLLGYMFIDGGYNY
jgi:hypothetical protein